MEPKNEQIDDVDSNILEGRGTSENHQQQHLGEDHPPLLRYSGVPQPQQQQFILQQHSEQARRQQPHQMDQINQGVLSNTELLSSLMGNNGGVEAAGREQFLLGGPTGAHQVNITGGTTSRSNAMMVIPSQIMGMDPAMNPSVTMQQQVDPSRMRQPQDVFALMEAQRRDVNAYDPALLQQIQQSQYQQHHIDATLAAQNQMMVNQQHQGNSLLLQSHDPLMLGKMLHQTRGMGPPNMPMEQAQSLFSTQMASRMALMATNPLLSAPPAYQRRLVDPGEELKLAGNKGTIEPFPEKLHRLLIETGNAGLESVIAFTDDGAAFEIHKPDRFFKEIVPKYFKQSRLSSFKRQLNLYGFDLIGTGPTRGGYSHRKFLKDKPELCRQIRRRDIKFNSSRGPKEGNWEMNAPDFYNMPPIAASVSEKQSSVKADTVADEEGTPTNTK
jgi:hypothetical protein